jgi:hypothetical protein
VSFIQQHAERATDLIHTKAGVASGAAGTVAAMTPTENFGEFLTGNGLLALSYAEWIQVFGGMWVLCLITDFSLRTIRRIRSGTLFKNE